MATPPGSSGLEEAFRESGATGFSSAVDDYVEQHGAAATARTLVGLVVGDNRELGAAAFHAIGRMGKAGRAVLPKLIAAMNSTDFPVEYLDEYDPGDIPLWLTERLLQPDQVDPDDVGSALAWTLDLTKEKRLLPLLIQGVTHANLDVRLWSVTALGEMRKTASPALPLLRDTLEKESSNAGDSGEAIKCSEVRGAAAFALGRIGAEPKLCIPLLMQMLKHHDEDIWSRSALGLGLFGEKAAPATPALVQALSNDCAPSVGTRHPAATALRNIGDRAMPALVDALQSPHAAIRRRVAEALYWAPAKRAAVGALAKVASDDPDQEVRTWATAALGFPAAARENERTLLSALTDIVKDDHSQVRVYAACAMGMMKTRDEVWLDLFLTLLGDQDAQVRRAAARAVPSPPSPKRLILTLERLLDAPDEGVRSVARETLNRLQEYDILREYDAKPENNAKSTVEE